MGLRYEAWTLPWSGDFKRVIAKIPAIEGSGRGTLRFREVAGDGSVSVGLGEDFDRLNEIISPTVGSLTRVFDGTDVIHEWVAQRSSRPHQSDTKDVKLSGPSLQAMLDNWVVFANDYPLDPSLVQDHIWGGANAVSNGDFSSSSVTPMRYTLWNDGAASDTFTLSDGIDTTSSIAWDATAATVQTRLETDIAQIVIINVNGEGTEAKPWEIEAFDPHSLAWPQFVVVDTGMTSTLELQHIGTIDPSGWEKSQTPDGRGGSIIHGEYALDGFALSDTHVFDGAPFSLYVNSTSAHEKRYAGGQQILNVNPTQKYQASVQVWPDSGTTEFRFVIRTDTGEFIASEPPNLGGTTLTPGQWNEMTIDDVVIPEGVTQVIFRVAELAPIGTYPDEFWIGGPMFTEGDAADTIGVIATSMLDDAALDHAADPRGTPLDWIDYSSWTATLDSSGATWTDPAVSMNVPFGYTYGHFMDDVTELGYEWELIPKAGPITPGNPTHDLNIYNKGNRDDAPTTAINVKQGMTDGSVVSRIPAYTAVLVEGAEGTWDEDVDATAVTNFGRMEIFQAEREISDAATLGLVSDEWLDREVNNRTAVKVNVVATPDHPRPIIDYRPGDTVAFQLPPDLPKEDRRVQRIDYANTNPTSYIVTGSVIYDQEAGGWELVRRLWRAYLRRQKVIKPVTPKSGVKGGAPTIVIAAADATEMSKNKADLLCRGSDDHIVIMSAVTSLQPGIGGRILLTEGTFNVDTNQIDLGVVANADVWLEGMGYFATTILTTDTAGTVVTAGPQSHISNMAISASSTTGTSVGITTDTFTEVSQVYIGTINRGIHLIGDQILITECVFQTIGSDAILNPAGTEGAPVDDVLITNNQFLGGHLDATNIMWLIVSDNRFQTSIHGIPSGPVVIANNIFKAPNIFNTHVIELSDISNLVITGNELDTGGDGAVLLDTCRDATITGNLFDGTGEVSAVLLDTCDRIVVSDNFIGANYLGRHGIQLTNTNDSLVSDNFIKEPGQDIDATFDGIILDGNSDRNDIRDNKIIGKAAANGPRWGINISAATCNDNSYLGNQTGPVAGYSSGSYNDAGTDTVNTWPGGTASQGDNLEGGAGGAGPSSARTSFMPLSKEGALTTGTGVMEMPWTVAGTITLIRARVSVAPTGADIILDVNKNGTTMYSTATNPTIAATAKDSGNAVPDATTMAAGDYLSVDIDQIGSTIAGSNLVVVVEWEA